MGVNTCNGRIAYAAVVKDFGFDSRPVR